MSNLIVDTGSNINYIIKQHTNTDNFIVMAKESGGNMYLFIYDNDLVLDRSITITSTHYIHADLGIGSTGTFGYVGASVVDSSPHVMYFSSSSATTPLWTKTDLTDTGNHFKLALTPSRVVVAMIDTTNTIKLRYLDIIDGSIFATPSIPAAVSGLATDGNLSVNYHEAALGYITVYFTGNSGSNRYAVTYDISGNLQTQSSYLVQDTDISGSSMALTNQNTATFSSQVVSNDYIVSTTVTPSDTVQLSIYDPVVTNQSGAFANIGTTFGTNISGTPRISSLTGQQGFICVYNSSDTLYYRKYTYPTQYSVRLNTGATAGAYIDLNTSLEPLNGFTVAFWHKPSTSGVDHRLVTFSDDLSPLFWDNYEFGFGIGSSNNYTLGAFGAFEDTNGVAYVPENQTFTILNKWVHVTLVYNSAGLFTLYLDSVAVWTREVSLLVDTPAVKFFFGGSSADSFRGFVTDIRLYNDSLSQSNVKTIYNNGTHTTNLVGWWQPSENTGITIAPTTYAGTTYGSTAIIIDRGSTVGWESDIPSLLKHVDDNLDFSLTPAVPNTNINLTNIAAAFPNVSDGSNLSSYYGKLDNIPGSGTISFSDLAGKTAPTPIHDFTTTFNGTNMTAQIRNSDTQLIEITGQVKEALQGAISFDLSSRLELDTQGDVSYELVTDHSETLPFFVTVSDSLITMNNVTDTIEPILINFKVTNSYGNYRIQPVLINARVLNSAVYSVSADKSTINEVSYDDSVTFTVLGYNTSSTQSTTVPYTVTGISASDLVNYYDITGNFTISNGSGTKTFYIKKDYIAEGNETMTLTLDATDSNGELTDNPSAGLTIVDTSQTPTFALAADSYTLDERDDTATITLTTQYFTGSLAITTAGTATNLTDYNLSSSAFTVAPSDETVSEQTQITLTPVRDRLTESGSETVILSINSGQINLDGTMYPTSTITCPTITLTDTSQTPTFTITESNSTILASNGNTVTITLATGPSSGNVDENLDTVPDGTEVVLVVLKQSGHKRLTLTDPADDSDVIYSESSNYAYAKFIKGTRDVINAQYPNADTGQAFVYMPTSVNIGGSLYSTGYVGEGSDNGTWIRFTVA